MTQPLYLFLISQTERNGWDTYDSAVVAAPDEDMARRTHPMDGFVFGAPDPRWHHFNEWGERWDHFKECVERSQWRSSSWPADPAVVSVRRLGAADPGIDAGVICASFNAG